MTADLYFALYLGICYSYSNYRHCFRRMKPLNVLGLTIFSVGGLALIGFGLYRFFEDTTVPLIVRWGIIGLILGTIIMLISLIIERIKDKGD